MFELLKPPQEMTLYERLELQLDAAILDLLRAINRDPLPGGLPEEEEWAATTEAFLVAFALAQQTGESPVVLVRAKITEHIEDDPEANWRLGESDLFSESFEIPELAEEILSTLVTAPGASGDFARDVADGHIITEAFYDTSSKISAEEDIV